MISSSGDPFGILATVIPIFFLAMFFGENALASTGWQGAVFSWLLILLMSAGEVAAIYGLVSGGPDWWLWLARFGAVTGLLLVAFNAVLQTLPPSVHDRMERRGLARRNIERNLARSRSRRGVEEPEPPAGDQAGTA